jgi:hypothetical protein
MVILENFYSSLGIARVKTCHYHGDSQRPCFTVWVYSLRSIYNMIGYNSVFPDKGMLG